MWINRQAYNDLQTALLKGQAGEMAQKEANKSLQANFDWMRTRITQLEKERAIIIEKFMGVKIPSPQFVEAPDPFESHKFNDMNDIFNGMSEKDAARLGVSHDEQGAVVYTK